MLCERSKNAKDTEADFLIPLDQRNLKATTLRIDSGRWVVALAQSGSICIFQQHYRAIWESKSRPEAA